MQILGEIKVDSSGRINIAKLFDELPKEVLVLYDTEEKAIFFRENRGGDWPQVQCRVDPKKRVTLPKWIREKIGEEYYIVEGSKERHCLLAKKFFEQI